MRCFTVGTKIVDHIEIELEPYPHVPVGEEGRGRKLTRFPLGQKFAEGLESFRETDYSRYKIKFQNGTEKEFDNLSDANLSGANLSGADLK